MNSWQSFTHRINLKQKRNRQQLLQPETKRKIVTIILRSKIHTIPKIVVNPLNALREIPSLAPLLLTYHHIWDINHSLE